MPLGQGGRALGNFWGGLPGTGSEPVDEVLKQINTSQQSCQNLQPGSLEWSFGGLAHFWGSFVVLRMSLGDLWASLVGPLGVPWELLVTFGAAVGVVKRSVGLLWDLPGGVLGTLGGPLGGSGVSRASLGVLWLSLGGCLGVCWETFGYLDGFGMLLGSFGEWGRK